MRLLPETYSTKESEKQMKDNTTPYFVQIWNGSVPLDDEMAKAGRLYLEGRGLDPSFAKSDSLRFHRQLSYFDDNKKEIGKFPALVCAIKNLAGELKGVQRIFITNEGQKASVPNPKKILGAAKEGAICFDEPAEGILA